MERLHRPQPMEKVRRDSVEQTYYHQKIETPVGALDLVATDQALVVLQLEKSSHDHISQFSLTKSADHPILKKAAAQLKEYFAGKRQKFDLSLEFKGTDFQKQVWKELLKIPYGKHITYGAQAAQIGRPKAVRAVGACNGKNPISIIVPCHRVIGASGALTGYAGGLSVKKYLLSLEGIKI